MYDYPNPTRLPHPAQGSGLKCLMTTRAFANNPNNETGQKAPENNSPALSLVSAGSLTDWRRAEFVSHRVAVNVFRHGHTVMTVDDFDRMNDFYDLRVIEISIYSRRRIEYLLLRAKTVIMMVVMMMTHIEPLLSDISNSAYGGRDVYACSLAYCAETFFRSCPREHDRSRRRPLSDR
ncbi:hypothetical protein HMPREF9413_5126 [Paenibacillus sp. HGF7]|nr:hypothetical protein HMPREF9413_5126 [Paenibacillus sp. HGF7]